MDLNAPRLYSDSFVLNFINQMSKVGLTTYAASVGTSVRSDIRSYYMDCLTETMQLYDDQLNYYCLKDCLSISEPA